MSRHNPYYTEDQRRKALELTQRFENERLALISLLKKSPTIKDMSVWMGEEGVASFVPRKFTANRPAKEIHAQHPVKPEIGFFDRLFGRAAMIEQAHADRCARVDADNAEADRRYIAKVAEWESARLKHEAKQYNAQESEAARVELANQKVREIRQSWHECNAETVVQYVAAVMKMSDHPPPLSPRVEVKFERASKILLIDYRLPLPADMPTTKAVRYNTATEQFTTTEISRTQAKEIYDSMCYQVCLRTINDIFRGDRPRAC